MMHPFVRACVAASACGVAFALSVQLAAIARADGPLGDLSGLDQLQGITIERVDALPTAAPEAAPPASAIEPPAPVAAPQAAPVQPAEAQPGAEAAPEAEAAAVDAPRETARVVMQLPAAGTGTATRDHSPAVALLAIAGAALIASGCTGSASQRRR
jgi:hypothetical protein